MCIFFFQVKTYHILWSHYRSHIFREVDGTSVMFLFIKEWHNIIVLYNTETDIYNGNDNDF